jgi:hypothetical protein
MAYTHKQTAAFVTTWQTSSTVAEVVCRLQESEDHPSDLPPCWGHSSRPISMKWARQRAGSLERQGVPLRYLPLVTSRATGRARRSNVDYTLLAVLARDLSPDND